MSTSWPPREAEITLVHRDPAAAEALRAALTRQCARRVTVVTDSEIARRQVRHHRPDLLLVQGPLDGARRRLLEDVLLEVPVGDHVPVMVVTGDADPATRLLALELGAVDVLVEPVDDEELCHRVRNHLAGRLVLTALQHNAAALERRLADREADLERLAAGHLDQLAAVLAAQSAALAERGRRIATSAWMLAVADGASLEAAARLRRTAALHDVGVLGLASDTRAGGADHAPADERHTLIGARLLGASHAPVLQLAASIALAHHERWDGAGHPFGLAGERIPRAARIVAVAEAFDGLTHARGLGAGPGRSAVQELRTLGGSSLDPRLVEPFVRHCVPHLPGGEPPEEDAELELIVELGTAAGSPAQPPS